MNNEERRQEGLKRDQERHKASYRARQWGDYPIWAVLIPSGLATCPLCLAIAAGTPRQVYAETADELKSPHEGCGCTWFVYKDLNGFYDERVAYAQDRYKAASDALPPMERSSEAIMAEIRRQQPYWDDALVDARISTGTTKLEDIYAELTRRDVGVLPFENLPDIHVPKSVGAKWASDTVNIEYDAGNGLTALTRIGELAEGSVIIGPKVIAGGEYGRIKDIDRIIEAYQGLPSEWLKLKGLGLVKFDEDDSIVEKELHWLQRGGKRYEIKIPRKKL